ncbi:MAG TPA: hypothetical protein VHX65_00790 [Pirellulales bacterium]|nr:hypothetical protein [Pirellulales bacterium]
MIGHIHRKIRKNQRRRAVDFHFGHRPRYFFSAVEKYQLPFASCSTWQSVAVGQTFRARLPSECHARRSTLSISEGLPKPIAVPASGDARIAGLTAIHCDES